MAERRYRAFISYRHADNAQEGRRWAEWMHRALERYVVPPDLKGTTNLRGEVIPESLYPIFRDEDELPANADLATGIRAALEVSDHLIVLCSPRSAVSPWVRKEVREFKELGRSDRILAVMIAGEPNADDPVKVRVGVLPEEECFCEELRFGMPRADGAIDWTARTEPLAADLRPGGLRAEGFVSADAYRQHLTLSSALATEKIRELAEAYHARLEHGLLKVIAGLMGVPLSQLTERDAAHRAAVAEEDARRQREIAEKERVNAERLGRRNRILAVAVVVILALGITAGVYWHHAKVGEDAAKAAQANEKTQRERAETSEAEMARKLHEASMADYAVAVRRIERDGKWSEGVAHLVRALEWEDSNSLAAARLHSTLALNVPERQSWPQLILRHESAIFSAHFSPDGSRVLTASNDGTAWIWDTTSGGLVGEPLRHSRNIESAQFSPDGSRVVTASTDRIARVWDATSGKLVSDSMRHEGSLTSAQFSPDGSLVVTASADGTARVWDAATGKLLGEPMRHEGIVTSALFSADGSRIVTASDKTARIWDAASGKPISSPFVHADPVYSARFSPDGFRIVTTNRGRIFSDRGYTAHVWDVASGQPFGTPLRHDSYVKSAQFSPEGSRMVTASADRTARVWDTASGKLLGEPLLHEDRVHDARFSPDGFRVVTASDDGTARVWDAASGRQLGESLHHEDRVYSAEFNFDGSRIVTVSADRTARVWGAATGKPLGEPLRHEGPVYRAQFSRDGHRVVTVGADRSAQVWDADRGIRVGPPLRHESYVYTAQFSPDGSRLVTASAAGAAYIWDATSGNRVGEPLRHESVVKSALFSPDGSRVLTSSEDKTARLWDATSSKPIGEPLRHLSTVNSARFSANGSLIITASDDGMARVWDATTGKSLGEPLRHQPAVKSAQFSLDGSRIITVSSDNNAQVWDSVTHQSLGKPLRHQSPINNAQFNHDGSRIVTSSENHTARIWDAASGEPIGEPLRHDQSVQNAQFSPDGTRVVTASDDKTARIWDAASGKPLSEPLAHQHQVSDGQFSPDGSRLVTTSWDQTARLWDAATMVVPPMPVPEWFLDHGRAVSGLDFNSDGELVRLPGEKQVKTIQAHVIGADAWARLARWMALPTATRSFSPNSKVTLRELAERERDSGSREGAESALRYDPTLPLVHLLLAANEKDVVRAQSLRDYDLRRLPSDAVLWARASLSLAEQKQPKAALHAAQKSLALDNALPVGQRALACALEADGQKEAALDAYEKLLASGKPGFDDFTSAGYLASHLGRTEQTKAIFKKAEQQYPKVPDIVLYKGWAMLNLSFPTEALEAFRRYELLLEPGAEPSINGIVGLAMSRWMNGDRDGAVTEYRRAIAREYSFADAGAIAETEYADLEKKLLLEVLAETLKRHPELESKPKVER